MTWPSIRSPHSMADPAKLYEEAEEKTCAGCAWVQRVRFLGKAAVEMDRCGRQLPFGVRCMWYREKKGHAGSHD